MEGPNPATPTVTRIVAAVIFSVLLVFLVVLTIGNSIVTLGSRWESYAYSIGIFLPVLGVLAAALVKSSRAR